MYVNLQCDLDEPCDPRVQCTNLRPGYKCGQCPPGYTSVGPSQGIGADGTRRTDEGRHRCVDIDECADGRNAGCAPNSQCINTEVNYTTPSPLILRRIKICKLHFKKIRFMIRTKRTNKTKYLTNVEWFLKRLKLDYYKAMSHLQVLRSFE